MFRTRYYKERFNNSATKIFNYKVRAIGSNVSLDRFYSNTDSDSVIQDLIKSKGHHIVDHKLPDVKYLNSVDVVTSFGVIEHINNPLNYLKLAVKSVRENSYYITDKLVLLFNYGVV